MTPGQIKRILENDAPIDYSDIPELSDEWFEKALAERERRLAMEEAGIPYKYPWQRGREEEEPEDDQPVVHHRPPRFG